MITLWMVYSLIVSLALAVSASVLDRVRRAGSTENDVDMLNVRPAQQTSSPDDLGAIQPNDIETVDVSKHAAGVLARNAVSIVTVVLNPGRRTTRDSAVTTPSSRPDANTTRRSP